MKTIISFLIAMVSLIVGLSLGFMLAFTSETRTTLSSEINIDEIQKEGGATIFLPAVNQRGEGVTTKLHVGISNGTGRALVDINQIIFWGDTQESIQTAREVAGFVTNINVSTIDLTYSVQTPATLIEGQSAGAALTIATIAAIRNMTLPQDIIITGTIEKDGRIGPVGGIKEKANASRIAGANIFLVPEGQSEIKQTLPVKTCRTIAGFDWCNIKFTENSTNIEIEGLDIIEVSTIEDVLKYYEIQV